MKLPYWLRDVPYEGIEEAWNEAIPDDKDIDAIRRVVWVDRWYLMIRVLNWKHANHPWVYLRCREVERDPYERLDLWSRGHFKSSIVTIAGTISDLLRDPDCSTGIFSHSGKDAKDMFLDPIMKEFENNQRLKNLFPDICYQNPRDEAPRWSRDSGIILKRKSIKKEASVEAHSIIDGLPAGKHFDRPCFDDIVTEKSVGTAEQIQKTNEQFSLAEAVTSLNARTRYCGTRYNYNDSYSELMSRGIKTRVYPATDDGTVHGAPVFFTPEQWLAKKNGRMLPADLACQYLLNPQAGDQRMFDLSQMSRYEVRPRELMVYIMCDPASSKKKNSDETAFVVVGVSITWNYYVLEVICHRMALDEKFQCVKGLREKYLRMSGIHDVKVGYESFGGGKSDLQAFEMLMEQEEERFDMTALEYPSYGGAGKEDRIKRLLLLGKKLHLPYRDTKGRGLTGRQQRARDLGEADLIAGFSKPNFYKQLDGEGRLYDALSKLETQIDSFPFTQRKDAIDALSRLFDMDPRVPVRYDSRDLEPDVL